MRTALAGSNVVIVARHFNPSVFSQLWLVRNEIVEPDEFAQGCIFTDQAVSVEAEQFSLLVVPPQLQFVPKVRPEEEGQLVAAKLGSIVRALPHTPYVAIGVNFFWHLQPVQGDIPTLTRRLFYAPTSRLFGWFDSPDARFGVYCSRDALGCRLKLDVKPVTVQQGTEEREVVQFAFNFHLPLPGAGDAAVDVIARHLGIWDAARQETERIIRKTTV